MFFMQQKPQFQLTVARWFDDASKERHLELMRTIPQRMTEPPWNDSTALDEGLAVIMLII